MTGSAGLQWQLTTGGVGAGVAAWPPTGAILVLDLIRALVGIAVLVFAILAIRSHIRLAAQDPVFRLLTSGEAKPRRRLLPRLLRPAARPRLRLSHDELYRDRDDLGCTEFGLVRVRIYQGPGLTPVIFVSELSEPVGCLPGCSAYLVAGIVARYLPERFEADDPAIWIEHQPAGDGREERYELVTFDSWRPRVVEVDGTRRVRIGEPHRRRLDRGAVEALVGPQADVEPPVAAVGR